MMSKYGIFKYEDFPLGIKSAVTLTHIGSIQSWSDAEGLIEGVEPYQYASFEQDEYITANPKPLYFGERNLGLASAFVSDENGVLPADGYVGFQATFAKPFMLTGITVHSDNIIKRAQIEITVLENDESQTLMWEFSANDKTFFYEFGAHKTIGLRFLVLEIAEPFHFAKIRKVEFGQTRIFGGARTVKTSLNTYFSVWGDTLEYNTLDLTVIEPKDVDYFFQKRQPIDFIVDNERKMRLYVNKGERADENSISLLAYNDIANLEDEFLGGIYKNYPLFQLLKDILGAEEKYLYLDFAPEVYEINVNGYLPISTRRQALQQVLFGTNMRYYTEEGVGIRPLKQQISEVYDKTNILESPIIKKNLELKSMTISLENYSKSNDETEIFRWFVSTTEDTKINFKQPAHSLKFYEVTGEDDNGNEIVSETPSKNITVIKQEPNYCIIRSNTQNKIVIIAKQYTVSTVDFVKINPNVDEYSEYEDKKFTISLTHNAQKVCNLLYELFKHENSANFRTLKCPNVGDLCEILGENLYIKHIYNDLSGVYEVEAV